MAIKTLRFSSLALVILLVLVAGCGPLGVSVTQDTIPTLRYSTENASVIVHGVVTGVMPARWTTPNGQPPLLWILGTPHTIYRPVTIQIIQFFKGQSLVVEEDDLLVVATQGGTVGETTIDIQPSYELSEGEEVVLFLRSFQLSGRGEQEEVQVNPDQPSWLVVERYIVENGKARVVDLAEGTGVTLTPIQDLGEKIRQILTN